MGSSDTCRKVDKCSYRCSAGIDLKRTDEDSLIRMDSSSRQDTVLIAMERSLRNRMVWFSLE
jgi:hypothetical protein